jgi:phenylacetic acid degradation protein
MFPGVVVRLEASAHIGHGAIVHGAHIGANALIGMNAVIMDNAVVGAGCVVGALCFVPTGMEIPPRKVVVGNPAKIVKDVTDDMLDWKTSGTQLYQQLPAAMRASWRAVEPLREIPVDRPTQSSVLKNWKDTREEGTT